MSNVTITHNVFYAIRILESTNNHNSVVVCSFLEFGLISKWFIREWVKKGTFFVAFVEDNATMNSIGYIENHDCIVFCAKPTEEVDPIKLISLRQTSVSIELKYIIDNNVLK